MREIMRKLAGLCLLLLLSSGIRPGHAQDNPWTAWLYNPNGTMTYVTDIGSVLQQVTLPILPGQTYPPQVAVARGGELVAYMTSNPELNADRLVIYHPTTGAVQTDFVATDVLQHSIAHFSTPEIFNEADTALAFSLAERGGGWRILILDVNSGTIGAELRSTDPAVTDRLIPGDLGALPLIRRYHGAEVAFVMGRTDDPDAIDGSYIWQVEAGTVSENTQYPGFGNDIFTTTGEIIQPVFDPDLPHTSDRFGGAQLNALRVHIPETGRTFPFYTAPDITLSDPHFIQNGERVLVRVRDASGSQVWRVLERSGDVVGDLPLAAARVIGMTDGFLYLTSGNPAALMYVNTRDGLDPGVLMGQGNPDAAIQLAWGQTVLFNPPPLPSITAWANVTNQVASARATQDAMEVVVNVASPVPAQPPTATIPAATATPEFFVAPTPVTLPTRASFTTQLEVGMRAVVVPDGHAAGLHTDPAIDAPAIILLYTDMVVDVLEGPNITDGHIWWLVRTTRDEIGWAIEGANGETWLAPVIEAGS